MENTFLCLLPCEEDSVKLYECLSEIFILDALSFIKLPLHVTLYYFQTPMNESNEEVIQWLNTSFRKRNGPIVADVEEIACFAKDGQDFVYYLPLKSKKIVNLQHELRQIFEHIHADQFSFIPHLSLFYPQRNLSGKETRNIQKLFEGIKSISFDRITLARENDGGVNYISVHTL